MREELIALERRGWDALSDGTAAEFYGSLMTPDVRFVVPGMVLDRVQTLASWEDTLPWQSYELSDAEVVPLGDDGAVLTYGGAATRADGSAYRAQFTSIYVRDGAEWKLAFHQQTPDPA